MGNKKLLGFLFVCIASFLLTMGIGFSFLPKTYFSWYDLLTTASFITIITSSTFYLYLGRTTLSQFSPSRTILISVFITIILGTLALALPWARTQYVSWLDLFFTATSVTCVTGLFPFEGLENFTRIGHIILMILMQIGALGLVTFTMFFISLFAKPGLTTSLMMGQVMEIDTWKNMKRLFIFIVVVAICSELIGASFMFYGLRHDFAFNDACFLSLFHAVASFCNAPGVSALLFDQLSMIPYANNAVMLLTTTSLIFIGGLGFFVWYEGYSYITSWREKRRHVFSLHSKIVFYGTVMILFSAAAMVFFLERGNTMSDLSWPYQIINSIFHATASRSSGVISANLIDFQLATIFIIMIISFIGSAPGSPGSGIKVTTLSIFFAAVKSTVTGRSHVEIMGRQIPKDQVYKSIAIVFLSLIWILLSTLLLLITEAQPGLLLLDVLFETISAFANLGLTTGITPDLSTVGKIIVISGMIIGRIGGLTLILALTRIGKDKREFTYPEERIALG